MADLVNKCRERIDLWEEKLRFSVERTQIESERMRIQRELAELSTVRSELAKLTEDQLHTLAEHLDRDPMMWVEHRYEAA